jgi:hypothetical protein
MECHYTGVWKEMAVIYRKQGLSEEEIADRVLCKTTKLVEGRKGLDECDKK